MILYHRTSIAEAREIAKRGFTDEKWAFRLREESEEPTKMTGVWLADRPLTEEEGPDGDAVLEVTIEVDEDTLQRFQLDGVFWDARVWVVPAQLLNPHVSVRILEVNPRTSWFFETPEDDGAIDEEEEPEE